MQMRAQLGLPFWDSRERSKATTLGWEYRLFTVFFGLIQWFTLEGSSGSLRFRHGGPLLERVRRITPASSPQPPYPRLLHRDCLTARLPESGEPSSVPTLFLSFNSYCIMVISTSWLQFTGHQPKRKRAELACTICHGKKVPIRAAWKNVD